MTKSESEGIRFLRKFNYTDCPFSSGDMKTALYDEILVGRVERRLNYYVTFREAAFDANRRPRFFLMRWIIGTFRIIKRILRK